MRILHFSLLEIVVNDSADPATRRRARLACDYQKAITNFNVSDDNLKPLSPSSKGCDSSGEARALVVDAYPDICPDSEGSLGEDALEPQHLFKGNETMYINDAWGGPPPSLSVRASVSGPNVSFVQVLYRGWPYVFVATTRHLAEGEELLIEYGEGFWRARAWWAWFESGQVDGEPPL